MKKILFVLKSITTHNRQNALCVERVAESLHTYSVDVDYLSWELTANYKPEPNIYTVVETERIRGFGNVERIISKAIHLPIGNQRLVKELYKAIVDLYTRNRYDAVVAVINPAECAEALYLAKQDLPEINAILYEIDPNSNRYKSCNSFTKRIWRKRSIRWEKKIYSCFDHIIHMITHENHYSSDDFKMFENKTIYLDIPNFESAGKRPNDYAMHSPIRFLYCGAFYPHMREPYYMFRLLEKVHEQFPLTLDIYTGNSMRSVLEEEEKKKDFIHLHREVTQEALEEIIESSDILVSIGNKDSDFLPSKTLKYMGTSKPIIHFFFDKTDVSLAYYQYYPAILNIMQENDNDLNTAALIIDFISKIEKGFVVDQEQLKKRLIKNTPDYSARRICELI